MNDGEQPDSERRSGPSVWDMQVFQKAYAAALEVHKLSQNFPKHEQYELASQLRRSSKSICANLAEGRGRQQGSSAEFRRFALIALGSTDETLIWCRFAKDLGYIKDAEHECLQTTFTEIAKMINGIIARLK